MFLCQPDGIRCELRQGTPTWTVSTRREKLFPTRHSGRTIVDLVVCLASRPETKIGKGPANLPLRTEKHGGSEDTAKCTQISFGRRIRHLIWCLQHLHGRDPLQGEGNLVFGGSFEVSHSEVDPALSRQSLHPEIDSSSGLLHTPKRDHSPSDDEELIEA